MKKLSEIREDFLEWIDTLWWNIWEGRHWKGYYKILEARWGNDLVTYQDLVRYPDEDGVEPPRFRLNHIEVETEEDKEQLLLALEYLHDLPMTDTGFVAVNNLVHLYEHPELIRVKSQ